MFNFSLEGKVALVTGGVYGIGFAIAKALHEAGAKIVYNCSTQKSMDLGVANYREAGIDAKGYLCDVTDEAAVKAMVADKVPYILGLGIKMGAVMELIPRVTVLFIEGLKPISEATRNLIARRFGNAAGLNIGMSPALVIGHPTTLVVSLLLIPVTLALAVLLPGNQFLPL
ncbi:MAG: SDR family NAD(P)-dependent oxidoreductase, partial [Alloprevotella sp.]|nr:SDR family NAD(P)-dependent oxidoreductase [Alloprevotella sp.]